MNSAFERDMLAVYWLLFEELERNGEPKKSASEPAVFEAPAAGAGQKSPGPSQAKSAGPR